MLTERVQMVIRRATDSAEANKVNDFFRVIEFIKTSFM